MSLRRGNRPRWSAAESKRFAIVGLIGIAIGAVLLFHQYRKQAATATWPSVEGSIVSARWGRRSSVAITYRYNVGNAGQVSEQVSYGPFSGTRSFPRGSIKAGDPVTVYYDPTNPGESVISSDVNPTAAWVFGAMGTVAVAIMLGVLMQRG